ncbi:MAG: haloacid dehalogenase type II [Gammaproteobacteria bacterium]
MAESDLRGIRACVFDAYGTLFDVNSAVTVQRPRLGEHADSVSASWRSKQLEYTWLRSLMGRHADFWQVTQEALAFALERHGLDKGAEASDLEDSLMQAYLQLSAYPEVPATLQTLNQRGYRLAILSNGTPAMLEAAVNNAGLAASFESVLSVEAVGIYKPDRRVYQLAVEHLEVAREQILFMSSNAWDVAGAASFGFRVVWINRFSQPRERLPGTPVAQLTELDSLPDLLPESASH